jgi:hypothetical protein
MYITNKSPHKDCGTSNLTPAIAGQAAEGVRSELVKIGIEILFYIFVKGSGFKKVKSQFL